MKVKELKEKLMEVISEKKEKINIKGFKIDRNTAMRLMYGNIILILKKGNKLIKRTITYKNMLDNLPLLIQY